MIGPCAGRCNAVFPASKFQNPLRQSFAQNRKRAVFLSKSAVFPHQRKSKIYFDGGESIPHSVPMQHTLLTAIADSIATAQTVSASVSDIDAAIRFIRRSFVDVDFDSFPDRVTIFGDDSSVWTDPDGDGDEGRFVLNLMRSVSLTANPFNE